VTILLASACPAGLPERTIIVTAVGHGTSHHLSAEVPGAWRGLDGWIDVRKFRVTAG
jgi:hypothetical protein